MRRAYPCPERRADSPRYKSGSGRQPAGRISNAIGERANQRDNFLDSPIRPFADSNALTPSSLSRFTGEGAAEQGHSEVKAQRYFRPWG